MKSQPASHLQRRAEPRGANDVWTIPLPARLKSDDLRLQGVVANLLALPGVRSVVVDGDRNVATVVFRPNRSAASDVAEIPTNVFVEPVNEAASDAASPAANASIVSWTDANNRSTCFIRLPASARGWRRALLLAAAAASLVLGLAGIVLPGLPTTPFVLVASFCLLRSSPALHARLLHSRLFGGVLRDWYLHRGLRPHVRYKAIAVVVIVLGASLLLTNLPVAAKLTIAAIAAIGITYVWRLPSIIEQVSTGPR